MSNHLTGLIPVMLTAFKTDLSIDWDGIDALVDFYITGGATNLFTCCLSSDMYELSEVERLQLTERVAERARTVGFAGKILATGTFGGEIRTQADFTRRMHDSGADIVVVLPNQLIRQDEGPEDLRPRLLAFTAMTGNIPLGLYECPAPFHLLIDTETLRECVKTRRFCYLKETSRDPDSIREKQRIAAGTDLKIFNAYLMGIDEFYHDGGRGMSPIASNYLPRIFSEYHRGYLAEDGRAEACASQFAKLDALIRDYPWSAKIFLKSQGVRIEAYCRGDKDQNRTSAAIADIEKPLLEIKRDLDLPTL